MPKDYRSFSADELLTALEQAGRGPNPELIRVCLERREELTPGLLEMLTAGADYAWGDDDPRWYREVHAGILLCAFREPAALPILAEILRDPDAENLLEWLHFPISHYYGPTAVPMLTDLLNDTEVYEYGRSSSAGMLSYIGIHHPEERERIVEALRAYLPPVGEDGLPVLTPAERENPPDLWTWVASALTDLRDTGSQPQVIGLYKRRLIDEFAFGDLNAYLAAFEPDAEPPLDARRSYDMIREYEALHRQAQQEAEHKAKAAQEAQAQAQVNATRRETALAGSARGTQAAYMPPPPLETFVRTQPKVGRNDPCPCGSGKKYKYCCGKKR
jgi:uncharacterized protein YchJ